MLRVFDEEKILEAAAPKARRIAAAFRSLGSLPGVARTRSIGMIGALDLEGDCFQVGEMTIAIDAATKMEESEAGDA